MGASSRAKEAGISGRLCHFLCPGIFVLFISAYPSYLKYDYVDYGADLKPNFLLNANTSCHPLSSLPKHIPRT